MPDITDVLADALKALMEGSRYGTVSIDGMVIGPSWNCVRMPSTEALDQAREALAKYEQWKETQNEC